MNFERINQLELQKLKDKYLSKKIELVEMVNESNPIEAGTQGRVRTIDSIGTLHTLWENGRTLGICLQNGDKIKLVDE